MKSIAALTVLSLTSLLGCKKATVAMVVDAGNTAPGERAITTGAASPAASLEPAPDAGAAGGSAFATKSDNGIWQHVTFARYVLKACESWEGNIAHKSPSFALDLPTNLTKARGMVGLGGYGCGRDFEAGDLQVSVRVYFKPEYAKARGRLPCHKLGSTAIKATPNSCWRTGYEKLAGRSDEYVYWRRTVVDDDVRYVLYIEYPVRMKADMDSVVSHINTSWHHPLNAEDASTAPDVYDKEEQDFDDERWKDYSGPDMSDEEMGPPR